MAKLFLTGLLVTSLLAAPVLAGDPPPPQDQPQAKSDIVVTGEEEKQEEAAKLDEVVCKRQEIIGTRLSSKRVCRTRGEWQQERLIQRQTVERGQQQRTYTDR